MKKMLFLFCLLATFSAKAQNPHDIVTKTLQSKSICGEKKLLIEITQSTWHWHIELGTGVNVWVRPVGQIAWIKIGAFTNTVLKKTFSVSGFGEYDIKLANASITNVNFNPPAQDPCIQFSDCSPIKRIKVEACKPVNKPPSGN